MNCSSSIIWCNFGLYAQLIVIKSAVCNNSSNVTYVASSSLSASGFRFGPVYKTFIPNAFARFATAFPISPRPIIPIVLPCTSRPKKNNGAHPLNPVVRHSVSPSGILRAAAKRSANVSSAVASVDTFGVFVTAIPFFSAYE